MTQARLAAPLVFLLLIAACGGYTDTTPTPPPGPFEPRAPEQVRELPKARAAAPLAWYERYGTGELVVSAEPGALPQGELQAERPRRVYQTPKLAAYERRRQVLEQQRDRLLLENKALRAQALEPRSVATPQLAGELTALRAQLVVLGSRQRVVNAHAQEIVTEHGSLLTLLAAQREAGISVVTSSQQLRGHVH